MAHPAEQMLQAMLEGWRSQQLSRGLNVTTIDSGESVVRRFHAHNNEWPWLWTPQMLDDWVSDLRMRRSSWSTVRGYQGAVRRFCWFITDPAYSWSVDCERFFGTHPVQICQDNNMMVHVAEAESVPAKRAFTAQELQTFLDYADAQVQSARTAGRKGWLGAFRDAVLFKVTYAWGLRRNETRMLDVADFGSNPKAAEFGRYGVCYVRHGKASRGSPPKRRGVLTVWDWAPEIVEEWITQVRGCYDRPRSSALFPSERADRVDLSQIQPDLLPVPDGTRAGSGVGLPLAAPLLRHPPDRGRVRCAVRAAAGRSRARLAHLDLHLRVLGLPDRDAAAGAGQDPRSAPRFERTELMPRNASYRWLLRNMMAQHGLYATTALVPLLADRGIDLSPSQVHRLVTQEPERLSMPILAALCDIFTCTPSDLIEITAAAAQSAAAAGGDNNVVDLAATIKPTRARIRPAP